MTVDCPPAPARAPLSLATMRFPHADRAPFVAISPVFAFEAGGVWGPADGSAGYDASAVHVVAVDSAGRRVYLREINDGYTT